MKPPSPQEMRVLRAMSKADKTATGTDFAAAAKVAHRGVYVLLARLKEKGLASRGASGWKLSAKGSAAVRAAGRKK
jgi:DNA-binding IclR family transcriptional regulator